jgi:signal transduction histidine kinase
VSASYARWRNAALIGLLLSLVGAGWWKSRAASGRIWYQLALHGALWTVRFAMIALDIPASFDAWGLFDPSLFASSFAYGAAKSPADLVISAVLLAFTVSTLSKLSFTSAVARVTESRAGAKRSPFVIAVSFLTASALVALIGPLTRGFHAVARSVVFDSRVELNDPGAIYPGVAAAMLLLAALLLVYSLIQGAIQLFAWARAIAGRNLVTASSAGAWALVFALGLAGSLLFDAVHPNPLGTPVDRLLMTAGAGAICCLAVKRFAARGAASWPGIVLAVSLVAVAALIPFLDEKIHDHDKALIEAVVRDMAKPEDAWMTVLLDRSLTTLADSAAALASTDEDAVGKLAFSAWAGSALPAEGNTCSVTYVDLEGRVVSHFHIGPAPHWSRQVAMDEMPRSTRFTTRETRTVDGRSVPWYKGYAPVFDRDSVFVGGVWVGIAPTDPWRILGQEQDLLTMSQKYGGRTPDRKIIVAEYDGGTLASASSDDLPSGRVLPATAGASSPDGIWIDETIGGAGYETYYYPAGDHSVIGAGLEALDAGWHFYSFSRYILFYGSVLLLCVVVYGTRRLLPRGGWKFSFRARLVAAFAVVSIIPVVLLALYNRQSLQHEAELSTDAFLRSETDLVLNEISGRMGMTVPYELRRFNDEDLEEIAGNLNTQVYLYDGPFLHGSSRPDLFAAELIDRRVPAEAFTDLYLNGRNFQAVEQSVGSVSYLVGYRAIRAQTGEAIGAVAVPSLSRQDVVRTDLARRDVILYGIYIIVLAIALLVGTGMAGQIARPVGRLTLAARRVSTGDLDVDLETGRGDELGQLETAFKGMTADLGRIQEKMVAVERELAWKEMAKQVAHEIKNPLTPMRLSVQHLVSAYQKGAEGFGDVLKTVSTTVLEQIEALSRIASEFSAFGRFPERRVDRCDIHAVIDEAIALFHGEGVRFASAYVPGSPAVKADREELRRAFINIFRNSVQAAGESEVSIGVTTRYEGALLAIAITDNGPGMTPEVRTRLFEPNFSTKTEGMGIGLTIVKKTIEDLDGAIEIDSAPGKGTTVRIRLPMMEDQRV